MSRALVLLLCLQTLQLAWAAEPTSPDKLWREVSCAAYKAKLYGSGRLEVEVKGGGKFSGSLIQWSPVGQTGKDVKLPRADARASDDRLSVETCFSFLWNGGRVAETLTFTSRSLAVDCEYVAERERDITWFAYQLNFPFRDGPEPELVGGLSPLDGKSGALAPPDWAGNRERFASLSVRKPWALQLDILAEGDGWLSPDGDRWNGRVCLWDKGRWSRPLLPPGEPLRLRLLLWFSHPDGDNLPATAMTLKGE